MVKRSTVRGKHGRSWTVSLVPTDEAEEEDRRFWLEELTAEERVNAVHEALTSSLKARGLDGAPRLRRVSRCVKREKR